MKGRYSSTGAVGIPAAGRFPRIAGGWRLLLAAVVFPTALLARRIDISAMPVSPYADTEVSTNVVLRAEGVNVRKLSLHIQLDGTPTNNLELAFGCDANTNGVLDVAEIDVVYGWRCGRYFIENVREWNRIETDTVVGASPCVFDIELKNSGGMVPAYFSSNCGIPAAFADLATTPPPSWLYNARWDMVRATRRGVGAADEWIHCETDNNPFILKLK